MNTAMDTATGEYDIQKMRSYIAYCKQKCAPRLSAEASDKLASTFVGLRTDVYKMRQRREGSANMAKSTIPITIRYVFVCATVSWHVYL